MYIIATSKPHIGSGHGTGGVVPKEAVALHSYVIVPVPFFPRHHAILATHIVNTGFTETPPAYKTGLYTAKACHVALAPASLSILIVAVNTRRRQCSAFKHV